MHLCLCLPLFVVLGPFCAVFNFAHLELEYYSHRWTIEVLFRAHKRYMGLKSFMVRAAKALDRLLLVLALAHFFFSCGLGHIVPFHIGLHLCRTAFVNS